MIIPVIHLLLLLLLKLLNPGSLFIFWQSIEHKNRFVSYVILHAKRDRMIILSDINLSTLNSVNDIAYGLLLSKVAFTIFLISITENLWKWSYFLILFHNPTNNKHRF